MSTTTQATDLRYCIAKATENIQKAIRVGRKDIAQQIRSERRRYQARLDDLEAAAL